MKNPPEEIPSFSSLSIRAMSPVMQEIAKMLQDAGYITINDIETAGGSG